MSWKNVKEHYRIGHTVHLTEEGLCIGSPYIHNLIVVNPDGTLKKRDDGRCNEDLKRYQEEMLADPAKLRQLIETPDTFGPSVTVYTYDGGSIIEEQCETPGWPNATHSGKLMYDNTFSTDKAKVIKWAKRENACGVENLTDRVAEIERDLEKARQRRAEYQANVDKLNADWPDVIYLEERA